MREPPRRAAGVTKLFCANGGNDPMWHVANVLPQANSSARSAAKNNKPHVAKTASTGCEYNRGSIANFFKAPDGVVVMTMWQPWASLLVYGVKRVEGRPWLTNHRGRMWIHASGNATENLDQNVKDTVQHYKQHVYKEFANVVYPKTYPTSVIIGCVDVVDVLTRDQFQTYTEKDLPMRNESSSRPVLYALTRSVCYCILAWNDKNER